MTRGRKRDAAAAGSAHEGPVKSTEKKGKSARLRSPDAAKQQSSGATLPVKHGLRTLTTRKFSCAYASCYVLASVLICECHVLHVLYLGFRQARITSRIQNRVQG